MLKCHIWWNVVHNHAIYFTYSSFLPISVTPTNPRQCFKRVGPFTKIGRWLDECSVSLKGANDVVRMPCQKALSIVLCSYSKENVPFSIKQKLPAFAATKPRLSLFKGSRLVRSRFWPAQQESGYRFSSWNCKSSGCTSSCQLHLQCYLEFSLCALFSNNSLEYGLCLLNVWIKAAQSQTQPDVLSHPFSWKTEHYRKSSVEFNQCGWLSRSWSTQGVRFPLMRHFRTIHRHHLQLFFLHIVVMHYQEGAITPE